MAVPGTTRFNVTIILTDGPSRRPAHDAVLDVVPTVSQPRREVHSVQAVRQETAPRIDLRTLPRKVADGYAVIQKGMRDIIRSLIDKHKDLKVPIPQTPPMVAACIKLFGEPKTELTFADYVFVVQTSLNVGRELGRRGAVQHG